MDESQEGGGPAQVQGGGSSGSVDGEAQAQVEGLVAQDERYRCGLAGQLWLHAQGAADGDQVDGVLLVLTRCRRGLTFGHLVPPLVAGTVARPVPAGRLSSPAGQSSSFGRGQGR